MMEKKETVVFSAYRSSTQTLSNGEKLIFDGVWINVGNGYEPSTGVFKAPQPGLYHFTAVVMSDSGSNLVLYLCQNGLCITRRLLTGDGYKTGTFDVVLNLQKGEKVYIQSDRSQIIYSDSNRHVYTDLGNMNEPEPESPIRIERSEEREGSTRFSPEDALSLFTQSLDLTFRKHKEQLFKEIDTRIGAK
ncbi:Hypothetical predicted protein [Mytilus galloprovincialis]|uniref:C1q domain-containing protein n=1 Tax=Mytilus galloprovincialis TaxID=29158 RepID=A0A8B6GJ92_MYTGA|nr:Hypothetical predicted protein [Mytilus galloprovincialis]